MILVFFLFLLENLSIGKGSIIPFKKIDFDTNQILSLIAQTTWLFFRLVVSIHIFR